MAYNLLPLPYAPNALEPHIDARTMEIHHGKHHQAYITNANNLLKDTPALADLAVNVLIADLTKVPDTIRGGVRNNAGGHSNHSFFWTILGHAGGDSPIDELWDGLGRHPVFLWQQVELPQSMTPKPFPAPADGVTLAAEVTGGVSASPKKHGSLLGSMGNQLPRAIGGGLLLLYLIGLTEQLLGFNTADLPTADMAFGLQLLERIPFLLLGYALMFWPGLDEPRRKISRMALKLASISALFACLLHLALGGLCLYATEQLYRRGQTNLQIQSHNQIAVMQRTVKEAPTLSEAQLRLIYLDLSPGAKLSGKVPAPDAMREAVASLASRRITEIQSAADVTHSELFRQLLASAIKCSGISLLGTGLFFLIWDQTPRMRVVQIFAPSKDPNLETATRMAQMFRRFIEWGERVFSPPDLENYRWYRRVRRWWQQRFKKKK